MAPQESVLVLRGDHYGAVGFELHLGIFENPGKCYCCPSEDAAQDKDFPSCESNCAC